MTQPRGFSSIRFLEALPPGTPQTALTICTASSALTETAVAAITTVQALTGTDLTRRFAHDKLRL